jgi:putative transposase
MTYPRSHLIDPNGGVYHVCSRCVRRAFLCGTDKQSGYNFDHRRQWIEDRILMLSKIFAIDIFGYAVMSNHYHIVLQLVSTQSNTWTDLEVVERWMRLNPRKNEESIIRDLRQAAILGSPERLAVLRERLGSLSWFMRYLNEPLARLANREDRCKGRFWEGRFRSQRLLDEHAILACMIYVDLNPIRAGMTDDATTADHTSLANRITDHKRQETMSVIGNPTAPLPFSFSLGEYIELARWTVEAQQSRRPTHFTGIPPAELWIDHYIPKPGHWRRALGSAQSIKDYAKDIGQCWIKTRSAQFS